MERSLPQPQFLFTVCQVGAEKTLKAEVAARWPELRFAFSRPGAVTFKLPEKLSPAHFDLGCVFARAWGYSWFQVTSQALSERAADLWRGLGQAKPAHLHVWQRDLHPPGDFGFEPGPTPLSLEAAQAIGVARPAAAPAGPLPINQLARSGELVVDCLLIEPDRWLVGWHEAKAPPSRWPGGAPLIARPQEMISRAYLKITEALLWSRLPMKTGDAVVEIGSAPGGSCQALLDRGLVVTGVDPAEMDPRLAGRPGFSHVRSRSIQLKRRLFRDFRWLTADLNTAPNYTLDTVEAIVTHPSVHIEGLLLTLKLIDWEMASLAPQWLDRVRSWGYRHAQARQLAHNRQEICVAAWK